MIPPYTCYSCVLLVTAEMPPDVLDRLERAIGSVLRPSGGDVQVGRYAASERVYPGVTHHVCWSAPIAKSSRRQPSLVDLALDAFVCGRAKP